MCLRLGQVRSGKKRKEYDRASGKDLIKQQLDILTSTTANKKGLKPKEQLS